MREHLDAGCPVCTEAAARISSLFDDMLLAAAPVTPPAGLRAECARRDAAARAATEALDCLHAVLALPHAALRAPVPALSPSLSLGLTP